MKTNILSAFAIALLASISVPVLANKTKSSSVKSVLNPEVTFLGTEGNNSLFSVQVANATPVKFVLTLTDAEGNEIYSHKYETANFSKVFKLVADNTNTNPLGLSFRIEVVPGGEKHDFEVSSATRVIKEVQITKL